MDSKSRVDHEPYQAMLQTILKRSSLELRILAEGIEHYALLTEHEELRGEQP